MSITTKYILPSKYDILYREAYSLVEDVIYDSLVEIREYGHLGIDKTDQRLSVEKFYHLLNLMTLVRQDIDNYVRVKGCVTEVELQAFKDKYNIDCLIQEGVCNRYTNNIVEVFLKVPICDGVEVYEWGTLNDCIQLEGEFYGISTVLYRKNNTVTQQTYYVEPEASIDDLETLLEITTSEATALYNERLNLNAAICCVDPIYDTPLITIDSSTTTSLSFSWVSNAERGYVVQLLLGTQVIESVEIQGLSHEFTGLQLSENYTVTVTPISCNIDQPGGSAESPTGPFVIDVQVCDTIIDEVEVTPQQVTVNFGDSFTLTFIDNASPYYKVTSVLVNGEAFTEIIYTDIQNGVEVEGVISLPFIGSNTTIELCGEIGNVCEGIGLNYVGATQTLEIINL